MCNWLICYDAIEMNPLYESWSPKSCLHFPWFILFNKNLILTFLLLNNWLFSKKITSNLAVSRTKINFIEQKNKNLCLTSLFQIQSSDLFSRRAKRKNQTKWWTVCKKNCKTERNEACQVNITVHVNSSYENTCNRGKSY